MNKIAAFFIILLMLSASCNKYSNNKVSNKVIFALFDLSGSTTQDREGYFQDFKVVLSTVNYGDVIIADKITDNPLAQSNFPIKKEIPKFIPSTDNPLMMKGEERIFRERHNLEKIREDILLQAQDLLGKGKSKWTDIFGAISLAEKVFMNYKRDKAMLIIMSDMIEDTPEYNFSREKLSGKRIEEIINKEKSENRLSDLTGIKVCIAGAKADDRNKFYRIQNFWLRYFKECGANLGKENYGSKLIRFNE